MIYQPKLKEPPIQARKTQKEWKSNVKGAILLFVFFIVMMGLEYWIMYEMGA